MKKYLFPFLFVFSSVVAQSPPQSKMSSTVQPSATMEGTSKPLEPLNTQKTRPPQTPARPMPPPPPPSAPRATARQAEYLHPGIIVNFNGRWEGSDHLLNLSNNIGINVSIVKPESETLDISEDQIRKDVEEIFALSNINPQTLVFEGKPPLPAFEIEIFAYPIERGYVAFIEGRLFESVTLDRFKMDPSMAFQAITWVKQHLIVSPKAQFAEQIKKAVSDISSSFTERFQAYERLKRSR